jgi:hypothetical protein
MQISRTRYAAAAALLAVVLSYTATPRLAGQAAAQPRLVPDVRAALAKSDFAAAEKLIEQYRTTRGATPEMLEAHSWLGRGALAAKQLDRAEAYARQTYEMAKAALRGRTLDQEPRLPIALGAAIEVQAQVAAERGARSEAIGLLRREIAAYRDTSIVKRLQKNINLIDMEGKAAPALDLSESLASKPLSLDAVKGKAVVLFFWAHWCPDCKVAGTTGLRFARLGGTTITRVTLRGVVDGHLEVAVGGRTRRVGPVDLLVSAVGWTGPETSPTVVGDTWDAFAQRLLVAHATRVARRL